MRENNASDRTFDQSRGRKCSGTVDAREQRTTVLAKSFDWLELRISWNIGRPAIRRVGPEGRAAHLQMNICASRGSNRGLGGIDVFVMIVTFALGAFVLLAYPFRSTGCKADARRISCVFNLKQVGLAARMWANDHDDRFAWQV